MIPYHCRNDGCADILAMPRRHSQNHVSHATVCVTRISNIPPPYVPFLNPCVAHESEMSHLALDIFVVVIK